MIDTGDTGFMMICSALVLLMTPGLAFFYGGMVRRKNVVNTMMTSIFVIGIIMSVIFLSLDSNSFQSNMILFHQ